MEMNVSSTNIVCACQRRCAAGFAETAGNGRFAETLFRPADSGRKGIVRADGGMNGVSISDLL